MSEIEVGEYVRTKNGFIGKIITRAGGYGLRYQIDVNKEIQPNWKDGWFHEDYIEKHSFKPIELIEKGDYVNGRLVLEVDYKNKNVCLLIPFTDTQANTNICWYGYEDIKSIVTKEQFENVSYKVGD